MEVKIPRVVWALGDRVQVAHDGVTQEYRPIYYNGCRVGWIDPDAAGPLMKALLADSDDAEDES